MNNTDLSEQENIRRQALTELRNLGIEPYPAAMFPVNCTTRQINTFSEDENNRTDKSIDFNSVCIAGRLMNKRIMGSASFAELQDEKGRVQLYLKRDDLCPGEDKALYNMVFKKLLDIEP